MKLIPLTQGKFAIVDDEDYDFINQWKWYAANYNGLWYAGRNQLLGVKDKKSVKRTVKMHRVLMKMIDAKLMVDHKNGNGLDNQKSNLRLANSAQNTRNRKGNKNTTSQHKGVYFAPERNKPWRVCVAANGKYFPQKSFYTEKEAAIYSNHLMVIGHGEFAQLNTVQNA